jgi:hypothetical protein
MASEIFGVYVVVKDSQAWGFYWDFLKEPEMQEYLNKFRSLEEFLEKFYQGNTFKGNYTDPEEGFFVTGSIKKVK